MASGAHWYAALSARVTIVFSMTIRDMQRLLIFLPSNFVCHRTRNSLRVRNTVNLIVSPLVPQGVHQRIY